MPELGVIGGGAPAHRLNMIVDRRSHFIFAMEVSQAYLRKRTPWE
jgi:hypothetical protein